MTNYPEELLYTMKSKGEDESDIIGQASGGDWSHDVEVYYTEKWIYIDTCEGYYFFLPRNPA